MRLNFNNGLLFLTFFIILLQSCTSVKMAGEYDEITDRTLAELQQSVSSYFVKAERHYNTHKESTLHLPSFFDDAKIKLNTLEIRTAALEKNELVYQQVLELQGMIRNLEKIHLKGFSSLEEIHELQKPFTRAFTSILKLQLALRRGDA